jgi:meiotically up-regulated gene 157 (Mug157) protein
MLFFIVWVKFYIFILNTPKRLLMTHKRNCPNCDCELEYTNKTSWYNAKRLNSKCTKCYRNEISNTLKEKYEKGEFNFILTGEISLVFTAKEKGRRVHLVYLAPSLEVNDKINKYLEKKGRRDYDGRPIFGMSCSDFVKDITTFGAQVNLPGNFTSDNTTSSTLINGEIKYLLESNPSVAKPAQLVWMNQGGGSAKATAMLCWGQVNSVEQVCAPRDSATTSVAFQQKSISPSENPLIQNAKFFESVLLAIQGAMAAPSVLGRRSIPGSASAT